LTTESTVPNEATLRSLCADLLNDWHATLASAAGSLSLGRDDQEVDPVRFSTAFAFVAHAHSLVGTACRLLHERDYAAAVPLLRVAYESAVTAVWAADSPEAAKALELEMLRGVKNLRTGLLETGLFDDVLAKFPEPTERLTKEDVAKEAQAQSRRFNEMCDALEPEPVWLYQQFRLLSSYAHPSGSVISMFAPSGDDCLLATPAAADEHAYLAWWFSAAMILLHAGQALDRLDQGAKRAGTLAAAGELLGWETPLRLKSSVREALDG
jgi:hypothetical protein